VFHLQLLFYILKYFIHQQMQLTPKTKNHQPIQWPGKSTNAKQQPGFGVNQANQKI